MVRHADELRRHARQIWQAGVDAVRSDRLIQESVRVDGSQLEVGDAVFELADIRRIVVVGGGKAGAGMALGLEAALGPQILADKQVQGWLNVPADCVVPTVRIHLHAARPAGVNEPTEAGVAGTREILRLVASLGPQDLCICLLSGGASALLPAPVDGISLADKIAVTRALSAAGANIGQLNTVRKQLSRIKGGGLARVCRAGTLITLVISDVLGDPLDLIGSGPTVVNRTTAADAMTILARFDPRRELPPAVYTHLERNVSTKPLADFAHAETFIIGNNALAVDAAGIEAVRLGYSPALESVTTPEPTADEVGRRLAELALSMRDRPGPDCLISGGEPVVRLAPSAERGRGGRNQQLVLAAGQRLAADDPQGVVILSGGTDGEDGPTDAAGAWIDADLLAKAAKRGLNAAEFLRRNDAYHYFEPIDGLIKTGPTHTNVCDLRVVLVGQNDEESSTR